MSQPSWLSAFPILWLVSLRRIRSAIPNATRLRDEAAAEVVRHDLDTGCLFDLLQTLTRLDAVMDTAFWQSSLSLVLGWVLGLLGLIIATLLPELK